MNVSCSLSVAPTVLDKRKAFTAFDKSKLSFLNNCLKMSVCNYWDFGFMQKEVTVTQFT